MPLKNPFCRNHSTIMQTGKQENFTVILSKLRWIFGGEQATRLTSFALELLRKLSYYRLLLTRLRLAKDCKGSNPVFTFKQKTGHSFCYALFFMAESKGLGSLRSPSSLLRKLSYYRLLLTRLRLAKDCKGSNPLLSYQQKNKGYSKRYTLYSWRRVRDSNPRSR